MKKRLFYALNILLLFPCFVFSASFVETFSDLTYIDTTPVLTTATVDTVNKIVKLPLVTSFTDITSSIYDLITLNTVTWNGSYWLICGSTGKITTYDGTSFAVTDLGGLFAGDVFAQSWSNLCGTSLPVEYYWLIGGGTVYGTNLVKFRSSTAYAEYTPYLTSVGIDTTGNGTSEVIKSLASNGSYYLVGTAKGHIAKWDGSYTGGSEATPVYFDNAAAGSTFATHSVNAMAWNGSYWLIGGGTSAVTNVINSLSGTTFTDLTAAATFTTGTTATTNCNVYSIAWNGSYFLVGGQYGKLKKFDGTTWTDLSTPLNSTTGGNFGSNGVKTLMWNGTDWFIGGDSGGKFVKWDGLGTADSNFISFSTILSWGTASINGIASNGTYAVIVGSGSRINRINAIYDGTDPKRVQSKKLNYITDRIYSAKLTNSPSLNGQTIIYYLSSDGGNHWTEMANGVEKRISYTGTDLRWRAELFGQWATPVINSPLTVEYSTCDPSVIPATTGGEVSFPADRFTKLEVDPGVTTVDTQFTIALDGNPPVSPTNPKTAIVCYDFTAKDYFTGTTLEKFTGGLRINIHWRSTDGIYIDNTNPKIRLANAATSICIAYWNGVHWIPLSTDVNVAGNGIWARARTTHLSKYAIVANAPTNIPTIVEPNPFTPLSSNSIYNKVSFSFLNGTNGLAELKIYDVAGNLVKLSSLSGASSFEWDGKKDTGELAESGLYLYEIKVSNESITKGTVVLAR